MVKFNRAKLCLCNLVFTFAVFVNKEEINVGIDKSTSCVHSNVMVRTKSQQKMGGGSSQIQLNWTNLITKLTALRVWIYQYSFVLFFKELIFLWQNSSYCCEGSLERDDWCILLACKTASVSFLGNVDLIMCNVHS